MESNDVKHLFTREELNKLLSDARGHEREQCAQRAWIALIKLHQPGEVRQAVTDAIRAREEL